MCSFKELDFPNPDGFEILVTVGSIQGHGRKVLVIACYIPPNYVVDRGNNCVQYIYEIMIELKRRYKDPYLVVTGDFNQWPVERALEEFRDMREAAVGPTRGTRSIDRCFTNFERIREAGTVDPLQTEGDDGHIRNSDHRVVHVSADLERGDKYRWLSYTYRYNNEKSAKEFTDWLVYHDWSEVLDATGSEAKTRAYQDTIERAIAACFPLRTIKRRSIDPPWINSHVKHLIKCRKGIFKRDRGRSEEWKKMKRRISNLIRKRKKVYQLSLIHI